MITLSAGDLVCTLDPETGGAVTSFMRGGVPLFRPVADPKLGAQHGRAVAGYPLVPYANRIAWGRFSVGGETYRLARNFGDHPHAIHGNGWMRAWRVTRAEGAAARLALRHSPPEDPAAEWPFRYEAALDYALSPSALLLTLRITNRDHRTFPAGLGFHPYVARTPDMTLCFSAGSVWRNGADALPAAREKVAGEWNFAAPRGPGCDVIDECYAGWDGKAVIAWPACRSALRIEADTIFRHLQLYTPAGKDYVGIEPVSHMTDVVNRIDVTDGGYRLIAPGESLEGAMSFHVEEAGV